MSTDSGRVTARIVRTKDGETIPEYQVGSLTYASLDALAADLKAR